MTLSFSEYWPERMPSNMANYRTDFIEKIWASLDEELLIEFFREKYQVNFNSCSAMEKLLEEKSGYLINWPLYGYLKNNTVFKAHTIREDKSERWKPGAKIHFVINNRQPTRFQFAPVVKCTAVQPVKITCFSDLREVEIAKSLWRAKTTARGKPYEWDLQLQILAQNDGFDSVEDFFAWFNQDFIGKIIYWTRYTY